MTFGQSALRLSGSAARLLGWRPDEFWRATPAELAACFATDDFDEPVTGEQLDALCSQFPDG